MIFMKSYKKTTQYLLNMIVIILVFFMLIIFSKDNVINLNANTLRIISPQGYAFFTRDPKEPQLFIYKLEERKIIEDLSKNSTTSDMLFGLSRKNRRQSLEMNEIFPKLIKWEDYNSLEDLKHIVPDTLSIKSKDSKKLTGQFLIIREKRIPWAWASNLKTPQRKFKFIYLK